MLDLSTFFDENLLSQTYLGATVQQWIMLFAAVLAATLVLTLLRRGLAYLIGRYAEGTSTYFDNVIADLLGKTRGYFLFAAALYGAALFVGWSERGMRLAGWLLVLALVLQIGRWANAFLTLWTRRYRLRHLEQDAASVTTVQALVFLGRVVLWSIVALVVLDHFGVNITTLVAGIGVTGIAVGFALQNILGDLFASLSIVFDRPFVLGDFLVVGEQRGMVEHIGLKSTRMRSLDGEQVIFSNGDLLASRVRNMGRMAERRALLSIGVTYQTAPERLKAIPGIVRTIVEEQDLARFDRAHFKEYGASSLNFEIVYFVRSPEYNTYMDVQHAVNVTLFERFAEEGIAFAYPTQTLYVEPASGAQAENGASERNAHIEEQ